MKKVLWILTAVLLPSLSFAQSRGDMLPFQGPTGAMSTLAGKNQRPTAEEEQTALAKVLGNLSDEGKAFKQVMDGFKTVVGSLLSNEQENDAAVVDQVVSELVSKGYMAEAFHSYITIQQKRADLLDKALEASKVHPETLPAKEVSGAYVGSLVSHIIDSRHADSKKQEMLKERQALLRYLNQFDNISLAGYLDNNLDNCTLSQDVLSQAKRWQQELAVATSVPF
ncbi:MAG: hypothetical protein IKP06_00910 [Elusimicrobiaceae bacterium]|nr:hypothetical protein [Elusimicrobiaceae bacterium]